MKQPRPHTTTRGFSHAASLMQTRIREASESRGFAQSRLLTHWSEVVGDATAAICRPVEVSYGKGGLGATLIVLTTGAQAPMLEMQKTQIMDRVNACYGYRAISRIRITQTAPIGFAEGQAQFGPAPKAKAPEIDPVITKRAEQLAEDVKSNDLRLALQTLAANVFTKAKTE